MTVDWEDLPTEGLLDVRMCDLGLSIRGTWLEDCTLRLREELAEVGLRRFRPHSWLCDEWCSPDGIPGIGVPFYLAHPRLIRLERQMMFEVEGGTRAECQLSASGLALQMDSAAVYRVTLEHTVGWTSLSVWAGLGSGQAVVDWLNWLSSLLGK